MFLHAKITLYSNFELEGLCLQALHMLTCIFVRLAGMLQLHGNKSYHRDGIPTRPSGTGQFVHIVRNVSFNEKDYLNGISSRYPVPTKRAGTGQYIRSENCSYFFVNLLLRLHKARTFFIPSRTGGIPLIQGGIPHNPYNIFHVNTSS